MKFVTSKHLLTLIFLVTSGSVAVASTTNKHPSSNKSHKHQVHYKDYKNEEPLMLENQNHFEIIGAGGISAASMGNSELGITSSETDRLVQTNSNSWNAWVGQVGAGYVYYFGDSLRYSESTQWFPSIEPELNYYYSSNEVKGDVYRFGSADFNDFNYKVSVDASRLMFDAALTIVSKQQFSLFGIAGIGEAWSSVGYNDAGNANNVCGANGLDFKDRNQSNFVWEVGAGLAYAFNDRANLSLEYLYTDFGSLKMPNNLKSPAFTDPVISASSVDFNTQAVILGLHIALS